jgi:hypothetical protein
MKIYFYNIIKYLIFLHSIVVFFTLLVVDILFFNNIIKLSKFIKFIRINYINIIFFKYFLYQNKG